MSYDIKFKVKAEGTDIYVPVGDCDANITSNITDMICKATGLEWNDGANNGLCEDVVPAIKNGLIELMSYPSKYEQYENSEGWGTVAGCRRFFAEIIRAYEDLKADNSELAEVATFWIE